MSVDIDIPRSTDGYLLQKSIPQTSLKRFIDHMSMNITKEEITKASKLSLNILDGKFPRGTGIPDISNIAAMDRYYVIDLSLPYNPPPDDHDLFAYYNDIRALSGSAGYVRIRDGYVYGTRIVYRS